MLDALAAQQARQAHQTITQADITLARLWWHYLSLGGDTGQLEVEAYLHQALDLPAPSVSCSTTPPTSSSPADSDPPPEESARKDLLGFPGSGPKASHHRLCPIGITVSSGPLPHRPCLPLVGSHLRGPGPVIVMGSRP